MDKKTIYQKEKEKIKPELGIVARATSSKIKLVSGPLPFTYFSELDFPSSTKPSAGTFVNLLMPRNLQKWSFYNELLYFSYKTSAFQENNITENQHETNYYSFEASYIKLTNLARYCHPINKNLNIFTNFGISNGFMVRETNKKHIHTEIFGEIFDYYGHVLSKIRKHEFGIALGLGACYKSCTLEMRYDYGNGTSAYENLSTPTNRLSLLFGLKIWKQ